MMSPIQEKQDSLNSDYFSNFLKSTKQSLTYFFKGPKGPLENNSNFCEFARYERSVANKLGYFAVSRTRFAKGPFGNYILKPTAPVAQLIYWAFYVNTLIKSVFLFFLIIDYFGPVVFLDKIAALDYILCVGIVVCGHCVWVNRYPIHEILHAFWTVENEIFRRLKCPQEVRKRVQRRHWATVWIHLIIVWVGCGCLVIQVLADPKYCTFTYSSFAYETWWLRIIFCAHEFFFMMHPWNNNTVTTSLCTIEAISLSNLIPEMASRIRVLYEDKLPCSDIMRKKNVNNYGKGSSQVIQDLDKHFKRDRNHCGSEGETDYKNIDKLIFDYKQLIIITDRFNEFVAFKVLALHICSYCQFISDVFVAIQVLKLEGTGFMDVWFYLEDCLAGVYMIYRVYTFMSRVAAESKAFLRAFHEYRVYGCSRRKSQFYKKISRTLKVVGLKLGPFVVTPMTVLTALDTFGNYYVCVALW